MKLLEIFGKKTHKWHRDESFDVWISADGEVIDLGDSATHMSYVRDKYNNINSTGLLVKTGWVKITNHRDRVEVTGLYDALKKHKRFWLNPILDKNTAHVIVNIVGKEKAEFNLPAEQVGLISLL